MAASKFHTTIEIPKFNWETGYLKKNIFMGSCFTENVGNRMAALKYDVDINPFGILYNPISVANGIRILLHEKKINSSDLIQHDGLWHSFFHHGRFSFPDEKETLEAINNQIKISSLFLKKADFLFITFGTAWIYKYKSTGQTVSNCHKIPSKEFERVRLSVDEIVVEYKKLIAEILETNPNLKIVFTVSPVRHWKDGAIENQRSKSTLLLAIDEITNDFGAEICAYFPAYEIVMDELRDYRFYTEDMIHINDVAIKHIWNIFEENFIDGKSVMISKQVQKIIKASNHRPFNKYTKEHLQFLSQYHKQTMELEKKYPFLNFCLERENFTAQAIETKNNTKL